MRLLVRSPEASVPVAVRLAADQGKLRPVVNTLLAVTFACGVFIAVAHVINRPFVAPVYDVVANLAAFGCAVGASSLLGHPFPAALSAVAVLCWMVLARRTFLDRRRRAHHVANSAAGDPITLTSDHSERPPNASEAAPSWSGAWRERKASRSRS